jgi:hypothetical protein
MRMSRLRKPGASKFTDPDLSPHFISSLILSSTFNQMKTQTIYTRARSPKGALPRIFKNRLPVTSMRFLEAVRAIAAKHGEKYCTSTIGISYSGWGKTDNYARTYYAYVNPGVSVCEPTAEKCLALLDEKLRMKKIEMNDAALGIPAPQAVTPADDLPF